MTSTWLAVLTELIPLALVVAMSPLSIIPGVLVLHTAQPRETGLAFLFGWLLGLGALTAVFVAVSGAIGGFDKPPTWASWVRIVIGVGLLVFGVVRFLRRHSSEHSPGWMRGLTSISPARAFGTAAMLTVVNPKVLVIGAAAGLAIGTAGLGAAGAWASVVYYALVAGSTVTIPILAFVVAPDRMQGPLDRLRDWMERNHAVLVAAILIVIGLLVLYKGIHGL